MALRSVSRKSLSLGVAAGQVRGLQSFSLPELPYDYGALEPVISGEIMQLHHQKHHQTYITNYNKALEQLDQALAKADSSSIVQLQSAIKFNGGGFTLSLSLLSCCWNSFLSLMIKLRKNLWYFQFNSGSFFIDKNRASILDILLRGPPNSKSKVRFLCFYFSKIESIANTNVSCNLWQSPPQPKVWKV